MRCLSVISVVMLTAVATADEKVQLAESLTFHASFDKSANADFSRGDNKLYTAESLKRAKVQTGLHADAVRLVGDKGKYGGALAFNRNSKQVVFYRGAGNVAYDPHRFNGTISFWLRLAPGGKLGEGFIDPIQVTDKKWNDASIFVDFTKDSPRQFRLGVFSDFSFWNPTNRKWEEVPEADRPLAGVKEPKFSDKAWTHVAVSYSQINVAEKNAEANLFIDGQPAGRLAGKMRLTWNPEKVALMIGLNYTGLMDDLAVFDRALGQADVQQLLRLKNGIHSLRSAPQK